MPRVGSGQEVFQMSRVGFGCIPKGDGSDQEEFHMLRVVQRRVGSGWVGSGRVGSGRVGSGRVGSGRVGSGQEVFKYDTSGRVGARHPDPIRPARNVPTRGKP